MISHIESIIEEAGFGTFQNVSSVSGGSINEAFQVETENGHLFMKLNEAESYPRMFEAESAGLLLLSDSDFVVPKPRLVGVHGRHQFIVMDLIEIGAPSIDFWEDFGRSLAQLHLQGQKQFGLDHDNYIGSLYQSNNWKSTWTEFYRDERLIPQMELAASNGKLSSIMKSGFEALFQQLDDLYPKEDPSLVHGDLWSGNLMVDKHGRPCIFDPAVYYGHREMDFAMMALFGGFGDSWVDPYNEIYPIESGWQGRVQIAQLYPLMVHVNLFGGSYSRSVESILSQFI